MFSVESPIGPIDYVVGGGLRLGRTGLNVGGFTTLEIDKVEGEAGVLELDSLNFLFLWEPVEFFRVFAEVEVGGLLTHDTGSGETSTDVETTFERLYADFTRNDAVNLRVGKFQTPIGIWNLVPAEPFTWTANEPILVEDAFEEHQTGAAFFGTAYPGSNVLEYWVYGQFMGPLDPSEDPVPSDRSVGTRLRYGGALEDWSVGASFLASEVDGRWTWLGGLDGSWHRGPLELQAEWNVVRGDIPERNLWGVYVQGAYDLGHHVDFLRRLYLVGRYEHFNPSQGRSANIVNLGLTWRPARFLVIKANYQLSDRETERVDRGLFSSISILF